VGPQLWGLLQGWTGPPDSRRASVGPQPVAKVDVMLCEW